jgi:hypothetical protein
LRGDLGGRGWGRGGVEEVGHAGANFER